MVTDTLTVSIDVAQPRVSRDVLSMVVDGTHWDIINSTAFVDPITRTGMLLPLCKTAQWATARCGRLGKADFSIAGSANWIEYASPFASSRRLKALGVNEGVVTNASWPVNQPFVLSWYSFGASGGGDEFVQMECGWSNGIVPYTAPSNAPDVRLRFWSNGKTEIFKNGVFVGEGNIFERRVTTQTQYGTQTTASKGDSKNHQGGIIDVLLIPCRRRELMLLTNQGGGFTFTFGDIDPEEPSPVITGAGTFFWYVPTGQAEAELAPLQMQTASSLISLPRRLRFAPDGGVAPQMLTSYDLPGYGNSSINAYLTQVDGQTLFVGGNGQQVARLRVDLTGDTNASPFVYGASAQYPAVVVNTDGTHSTVLDTWIKEAHLSVPESPTDVLFSLTCKNPDLIEAAGAAQIRTVGNRPLTAKIGTVAIITGVTKAPQWVEALDDTSRDLVLETRDRVKQMENHRMKDPVPIDGINVTDGLKYFAMQPGFVSGDMDIQAFDYALPTVGQQSQGEWALLPDVGDTSLQWFQKLYDTFAKQCLWGWVPRLTGPKLRLYDMDTLAAQAPAVTLYPGDTAAQVASIPAGKMQAWYRSYRNTSLEPEANDVWVTGRNPRTGYPLLVHYADAASQDPTLAPSLRPNNWLGELRYYGVVNEALTTLADCNYVCEQAARRVTPRRDIGEWQCDFLRKPNGEPVWRMDVVRLSGIGNFRVISLSGDMKNEHAATDTTKDLDMIWRPFTYVGERVSA